MKRTLAFVIILALLLGGNSVYASAVYDTKSAAVPFVTVEYLTTNSADEEAPVAGITDTGIHGGLRVTVIDLSTSGSVDINWAISGNSTVRSTYNYTTASTKIILIVASSPTSNITFTLYDSSDVRIATQTVQLSSSPSMKITFSNLLSNREYYIKAQNVGQGYTTVTGTISAK